MNVTHCNLLNLITALPGQPAPYSLPYSIKEGLRFATVDDSKALLRIMN